jgi:hypothetical protein
MGGTLFGDRADQGKAVGCAHSGDIVPANAGCEGRVGAEGEVEEPPEPEVPDTALRISSGLQSGAVQRFGFLTS